MVNSELNELLADLESSRVERKPSLGPTTRPATQEEERRLAERRRGRDLTFDLQPVPSASLDDLDLELFRDTYLRDDPHAVHLLMHYRSLMPMAQEARKPMFHLKPADGAIGSHFDAAQAAHRDFEAMAREIAHRIALPLPARP